MIVALVAQPGRLCSDCVMSLLVDVVFLSCCEKQYINFCQKPLFFIEKLDTITPGNFVTCIGSHMTSVFCDFFFFFGGGLDGAIVCVCECGIEEYGESVGEGR